MKHLNFKGTRFLISHGNKSDCVLEAVEARYLFDEVESNVTGLIIKLEPVVGIFPYVSYTLKIDEKETSITMLRVAQELKESLIKEKLIDDSFTISWSTVNTYFKDVPFAIEHPDLIPLLQALRPLVEKYTINDIEDSIDALYDIDMDDIFSKEDSTEAE